MPEAIITTFSSLRMETSGFFLADVSGHGTPAAVIMAIIHSMAHLFHGPEISEDPGRMLDCLNHHLFTRYTADSAMFVTAFFGIFDPVERRLLYANAGHNPPRLCQKGGEGVKALDASNNFPLGLFLDQTFSTHVESLRPDDLLVFYTDGITEAMNKERNLFGLSLFDKSIQQSKGTADEALAAILAEVETFTAGHPPDDDRALGGCARAVTKEWSDGRTKR